MNDGTPLGGESTISLHGCNADRPPPQKQKVKILIHSHLMYSSVNGVNRTIVKSLQFLYSYRQKAGKVFTVHVIRTSRIGGTTPLILNFGTRQRWLGIFTARPLFPRCISPWLAFPLNRRLSGAPRSSSRRCKIENNSFALSGIKTVIRLSSTFSVTRDELFYFIIIFLYAW
jgi:hypothetical protein